MKPERRMEILECALESYEESINKKVRDYLARKRGLSEETIKTAHLGYAPAKKGLLKHLYQHGFTTEEAIDVGLFRRIRGKVRPVFRKRIIFPNIRGGRVVNLQGRTLPQTGTRPNEEHKYLKLKNPDGVPPEAVFFGEPSVKRDETLIITEGPFDVLHAMQNGFAAVALGGVHVGSESLSHFVDLCAKSGQVVIVFDQDSNSAGQSGAMSLGEKLEAEGVRVKIAELPTPKRKKKVDLAGFLKKAAPDAREELTSLVMDALPWLDLRIEAIPADLPRDQVSLQLRPLLLQISVLTPVEQRDYYKTIKKKFKLTQVVIKEETKLAHADKANKATEERPIQLSAAERNEACWCGRDGCGRGGGRTGAGWKPLGPTKSGRPTSPRCGLAPRWAGLTW